MQVKTFEEQENCLYADLHSEGGTYCYINEMTLFVPNSEGHYEMFSPDTEKIISDIENRISVSIDNASQSVTIEIDDKKYEQEFYEDNILPEYFIFPGGNIYYYDYNNNQITFTSPIGYGKYLGGGAFVDVIARISFKNNKFEIEDIEFSDYGY